jgi:hypothetical protein
VSAEQIGAAREAVTTTKAKIRDGIIFILDVNNRDAKVPTYDETRPISATGSCVSVATASSADGEITLVLERLNSLPANATSRNPDFRGAVKTPSGKIGIVSSQMKVLAQQSTRVGNVDVLIFLDSVASPRSIAVYVR